MTVTTLDIDTLIQDLIQYDFYYAIGTPKISDIEYDNKYDRAKSIDPTHPYFSKVGVKLTTGNTVRHPSPMLSTAKAYSTEALMKWLKRQTNAYDTSMGECALRCTPKFDGIAARYNVSELSLTTRGEDGLHGSNISHLLGFGLRLVGDALQDGVGEIVMKEAYFHANLSKEVLGEDDGFANSRNYLAGLVNADQPKPHHIKALQDGAVELVIYRDTEFFVEIPLADVTEEAFIEMEQAMLDTPYLLDGVVFEVTNTELKAKLGSNSHDHNWQVAKKQRGEVQRTTINGVAFQVGRNGFHTPVVTYDSVIFNGTVNTNATAHHCGNLLREGLGIGAEILITKGGEIIPYIVETVKPAPVELPTHCVCCETELKWQTNDEGEKVNLVCTNDTCDSRIEASVIHHFDLIGVKGIGGETAAKLVNTHAIETIADVYDLTLSDWIATGIGVGVCTNILNEINRVKREPLADYLLLGSLGIPKLGRGSSKRVLAVTRISEVAEISRETLKSIETFADKKANLVCTAFEYGKAEVLERILAQGFNLIHTQDALEEEQALIANATSQLAGKTVVFTGKCTLSRAEMETEAKEQGMIPQARISQTDYLVCGERVGATKMDAARKKGVTVLTEAEYRALL